MTFRLELRKDEIITILYSLRTREEQLIIDYSLHKKTENQRACEIMDITDIQEVVRKIKDKTGIGL